jgi:osmotically-inducible protein OsmY
MRKLSLTLILVLLVGMFSIAWTKDKDLTDGQMMDLVRLKLAGDPDVRGGGLSVEVNNGVVTIRGTVGNNKAKQKATKLAKKVRGVKSVDNQLSVKP